MDRFYLLPLHVRVLAEIQNDRFFRPCGVLCLNDGEVGPGKRSDKRRPGQKRSYVL